MKYQKPSLVYLSEATTAIQGSNPGLGKVFSPTDGQPAAQTSTVGAYPVDEE